MQDATKEWRGGWICLCQSRKVEFVGVVSCPLGVMLDEHHSLCEQAIQCHFAVYYTSVTAVGNTERCDEGVDQ